MLRALSVLALLSGCGDDGGSSALSGGTGGTGGSSEGSSSESSSTSSSSSTDAATSSSSDPGSSSSEGSSSSSSSSGGTTAEPTTTTDTSGGASPFGQCISVDVWESCAQYCEAEKDACQEGGCDGATVLYYDSGGECDDMRNGQPSDQACDDPLQSGGGTSFARCCCG